MTRALNTLYAMQPAPGAGTAQALTTEVMPAKTETASAAVVILNADDWGRDVETTDRELECVLRCSVSSVSGMVFMKDSERAADFTRQYGVDTGLHLNLTLPFSNCSSRLEELHGRVARFLLSSRLAQIVYHPGLVPAFEYVVKAQLDEFERLYGIAPHRIDGHHHMHLCGNVYFQKLLPEGTIVRRNFSFAQGEKSVINRRYRGWQDNGLARRHRMTDYFFSLPPLEPESRLQSIFNLARRSNVEIENHPIVPEEYRFLTGGGLFRLLGESGVANGYTLRASSPASSM
jgi:hypothetical protein